MTALLCFALGYCVGWCVGWGMGLLVDPGVGPDAH